MPNSPTLTVNARKYDGSIRRSWQAGLMSQSGSSIVLVGRFMQDVFHDDLGHIAKDTASFEYFWTDRWYNVFTMYEPDGSLRNHYCNIAQPAELSESTLDFIDMDIDVVVWPDGNRSILDLEDFVENTAKYGYTPDVIEDTKNGLRELLNLIDHKEFPFNESP